MSELKEYHSSFTGQEVDELLTKVKDGSVTANIEKELVEKADKSGYYPQLHVGLSDNLPDRGDVTEGLIGFRESAGADNSIEDGTANVQELLGESLVWNQLWDINGDNRTDNVANMTINEGEVVLTIQGIGKTNRIRTLYTIGVVGHKYYVTYQAKYNSKSDDSSLIAFVGMSDAYANQLPLTNSYQTYSGIWVGDYAGQMNVGIIGTRNDGDIVSFKDIKVIDLTQMFGAGKEPTTIEEFNAIKNQLVGVDFNAYNAGEVLGVNIKGIKSVNDNAFNGEYAKVLGGREYCADGTITSMGFTREIGGTTEAIVLDGENKFIPSENGYVYASGTDICIHLVHSGYKDHVYTEHEVSESSFDLTPYFPNGMHGIGDVRDSVTPKKATKRIGVAKMKDLNWRYYTESGLGNTMVRATLEGIKIPTTNEERVQGVIVSRYYPTQDNPNVARLQNKCWLHMNGEIFLKDDSFADAASFVASLTDDDVIIYELATPIETEIDPQLNMNYKVWDFGTEELLTDSKSAPVLARTIYGFNATDTIRGNKAKNEEQDVRLQTLESEVVRIGDYQPDLSVGVADQLAGQDEPTPSEINFRRSGGGAILDGNARIEAIKGNSVVWNQGFKRGSNKAGTWEDNILTIDNVYDEKYSTYDTTVYGSEYAAMYEGHKYLLIIQKLSGTITGTLRYYPYYFNQYPCIDITSNGSYGVIGTLRSMDGYYYWFVREAKGQFDNVKIRHCAYDLTQMFGSGNEPTTIEEFYQRIPSGIDLNAYNEGEVIHMTAEGIKSVGDNAWDEQWELGNIDVNTGKEYDSSEQLRAKNYIRVLPNAQYYAKKTAGKALYLFYYDEKKNFIISQDPFATSGEGGKFTTPQGVYYMRLRYSGSTYNHDICINLFDASINGKYFPYVKRVQSLDIIRKYFPDGMKSAGTAHDEIRYNKASGKWEAVQRIGSVDMGSMAWSYDSANQVFTSYTIMDLMTHPAEVSERNKGLLCSKYSPSRTYIASTMDDKSWLRIPKSVTIKDTSYTDAATFKADMAGVILYYELAEPIVTELDKEDQLRNFDYQVWNCGTEQAIANVPSTPLKADIVYGFNAYGTIKQLKEQMATLMTQMAQMQTAMASVTSNKE